MMNLTRTLTVFVSLLVGVGTAIEDREVNAQSSSPARVGKFRQEIRTFYAEHDGLASSDVRKLAIAGNGQLHARTANGDCVWRDAQWRVAPNVDALFTQQTTVPEAFRDVIHSATATVARGPAEQIALGTEGGLFLLEDGDVRQIFPQDTSRRWAPTHVKVAYDGKGRLWFASKQGAGCLDQGTWTLYTGADGLPYDDMTAIACGANGTVWFGTKMGVIRFDGTDWAYRQGKRWLPHDDVRDVVVDQNGNAWIATAGGIAFIHFKPMTLADKAAWYEDLIDKHHRRTKFGYVIEGRTGVPGQYRDVQLHASDNDGLWTSMYGAGECFAYGATKAPIAKRRAKDAFEALRFLSEAPKGSQHAPPAGFIARTVLETEANPDPNQRGYTLEAQRQKKKDEDGYWRVYEPRWPKSADGEFYWKSDTSSDELDGHYFFYALYYDLVAETESEKSRVREIVRANIDHLIAHDFSLYDHAGRTRWAVYDPKEINHNPEWFAERGLNSISMLSYLNVAHHLTGDAKYLSIAKVLRDEHGYAMNVLWPKHQRGIGSGNHSDDEMAFMAYYNLIRYEPDPELKKLYVTSFANSWRQEEPEMNPFFNFCFAAVAMDVEYKNIWGTYDLSPWPSCFTDSIKTLKQFPLDRFNWRHTNHQRKDLVMLSDHWADAFEGEVRGQGYRNCGKVIPVDERHFNHWNTNPWRLDTGGDGHGVGTGAVFTLPYYMGLYHGFITEDERK